MSNSQNENLEDVSKGNKESIESESIDSTSNKKTRFTKSKSISEVFKELDSEDDLSLDSVDASSESVDDDFEDIDSLTAAEESALDSLEEPLAEESALNPVEEPLAEDDEIDEIIPIHNEYKDLDESEAFNTESIDGDDESSEVDSYIESIVNESDDFSSDELADSKENLDAIGGEDHLLEDDVDEEDSIDGEDIPNCVLFIQYAQFSY